MIKSDKGTVQLEGNLNVFLTDLIFAVNAVKDHMINGCNMPEEVAEEVLVGAVIMAMSEAVAPEEEPVTVDVTALRDILGNIGGEKDEV